MYTRAEKEKLENESKVLKIEESVKKNLYKMAYDNLGISGISNLKVYITELDIVSYFKGQNFKNIMSVDAALIKMLYIIRFDMLAEGVLLNKNTMSYVEKYIRQCMFDVLSDIRVT